MLQLLLCSIMMRNIQMFYGGPVMSQLMSQLLLLRTELTRYSPSILMENCDHTISSGVSVIFLYAPAHNLLFIITLLIYLFIYLFIYYNFI